jgi:hypothetical protein
MKPRVRFVFASLFLLVLSTAALWAEDDPPGRVARLQYVSGSVSIQPQGTQDWVEATQNRPLTTSDNIWADKNSRVELSVGTALLRMNSESSLTFTNLSDRTVQVQLHQGTLNLHLRKLYDGEIYEIDTPNMAFTVQKSGDYRFDVDPEADASSVTVWKGRGDATGEGSAVRVDAHERAHFTNGTSMAHTFSSAPGLDGFDDWCVVRDHREDHYASARYVSPDVIGYEDLDDYGYWETVPSYGPVWVPRHVVAGWAPYRYGHWVWVSPWGWTWVDDAPWGFAPFHYGRWVYYRNYWGWAPGPVYVRPVYAPALVAWFGGHGWGVSVGFGGGPGYGWCPLGYGEPFVPWYRGSRGYFHNVNVSNTHITNITNITNIYNNQGNVPWRYTHLHSPGGATVVSESTIVGSRPVSKAIVHVPQGELSRAPWNSTAPTPTRTSMLGENAGRPAALPPQRSFARPVVSRVAAPVRTNTENIPFNRGGRPESGGVPQRVENGRMPEHEGQQPVRQGAFGGNAPARNIPRPPTAENPRSGAIVHNTPEGSGSFSRPNGNGNVPRPQNGNNNPVADRNPNWEPGSPRSGAVVNNRPESGDHGNFSRPTGTSNIPRPPANNNSGGNERPNMPQRMERPSELPRSGAIVNNRQESGDSGNFARTAGTPNVPHPPANNNSGGNERPNMPQRMERPTEAPRSGAIVRSAPEPQRENVSRPPANIHSAPQPPANNNNGRSTERSQPQPRNFKSSPEGGRSMYVPRPTGRVLPAGNQVAEYRAPQNMRGYSAPDRSNYSRNSYQQAPRSYSEAPRNYSMGNRSYDGGTRSYNAAPRYSAPSASRGSMHSNNPAPSYRSAPSSQSSGGGSRHR